MILGGTCPGPFPAAGCHPEASCKCWPRPTSPPSDGARKDSIGQLSQDSASSELTNGSSVDASSRGPQNRGSCGEDAVRRKVAFSPEMRPYWLSVKSLGCYGSGCGGQRSGTRLSSLSRGAGDQSATAKRFRSGSNATLSGWVADAELRGEKPGSSLRLIAAMQPFASPAVPRPLGRPMCQGTAACR